MEVSIRRPCSKPEHPHCAQLWDTGQGPPTPVDLSPIVFAMGKGGIPEWVLGKSPLQLWLAAKLRMELRFRKEGVGGWQEL